MAIRTSKRPGRAVRPEQDEKKNLKAAYQTFIKEKEPSKKGKPERN